MQTHEVETVKTRPHHLQNIYTARFSEPLRSLSRMLGTKKHCSVIINAPQKTACVSRNWMELRLLISATRGPVQETSHARLYPTFAMDCNRVTALRYIWSGANPREPVDTNSYWHFFVLGAELWPRGKLNNKCIFCWYLFYRVVWLKGKRSYSSNK